MSLREVRLRITSYNVCYTKLLRINEIYLWETPFRYGIHRHPNIYVPYYIGPEAFGRTSPYDPGYYTYPYTPYWIRPPGTN